MANILSAIQSKLGSKTIQFVALVAIVAAIPITVFLSQQQQDLRQRASEVSSPPFPITPPPSGFSRVFVTSTTYNGNLGGIEGADAKCQERANAAKLGGTWKAWLSAGQYSPSVSFIKNTGPYKNVLGNVIANNWTDLTDQTLINSITVDENGAFQPVVEPWNVWTNTWTSGSIYDTQSSLTCNNWTSSSTSLTGRGGASWQTDYRWTGSEISGQNCSTLKHLYCFEQGSSVTPALSIQTPTPVPSSIITSAPTTMTTPTPAITTITTPTPTPNIYGGAYKITLSNNTTNITCVKGDPNCYYMSSVSAANKISKPLYKTTIYSYNPLVKFVGFDGTWTSSKSQTEKVLQPGQGITTMLKVTPPQSVGEYYGTLYIDGQTCGIPTSCTYYGATQVNIKIKVVEKMVTPTPTPKIVPLTSLRFIISLPGIGIKTGENNNPLHAVRNLGIQIVDSNMKLVSTNTATLNYNKTTGKFSGMTEISKNISSAGIYHIRMKTTGYLSNISLNNYIKLGVVNPDINSALAPGDIDEKQDNQVNYTDYTSFLRCYMQDIAKYPSCTIADFNDDGRINAQDYALFYSSYGKKGL